MRIPALDQTLFQSGRRPVLASAIVASACVFGSSACIIHVDGDTQSTGGGGSTSTSTAGGTGGAGGVTLSTGGSTGGAPTVTCSPAPALQPDVTVTVPDGITADFAVPGRVSKLATAPDGDVVVLSVEDKHAYVKRYHEGQWSDLEQVASPMSDISAVTWGAAAVATGGAGRALIVYGELQNHEVALCARRYEPSAGWSEPELVGVATEGWWQDPSAPPVSAAMWGNGDSMIVWPRAPDADAGLYARHGAMGAPLVDAEELSDATIMGNVALEVKEDGRAVVAWNDTQVTSSRVFDPASGWSAVQELGPFGWDIRLAGGANGSTLAVWGEAVGPDGALFKTAALPSGTVFDAATELDPSAGYGLTLATAADGTGVVTWHQVGAPCQSGDGVMLRDAGGAFTSAGPVTGLEDGVATTWSSAAAAGGKVALAWGMLDKDCGPVGVGVSFFDPVSGVWQKADLDPAGDTPSIALSPEGQGLVVWSRFADKQSFFRRMDLPAP